MSEKKVHNLKILPEFFEKIKTGEKAFEIRKCERGFEVNDLLCLNEFDGVNYTGEYMLAIVNSILEGGQYGVNLDYVVISIT